jgi:hypothetical protein
VTDVSTVCVLYMQEVRAGHRHHSLCSLQASSANRTSMSAARTPVSMEACAGTT